MAIAFAEVKTHSRKHGHSAVAASAYRTRSRMVDERTGEVFDYTHKADELEHTRMVTAGAGKAWQQSRREAGMSDADIRSELWNAVEEKERRYDSRIGRDYTVALPWELTAAQRQRVTYEIAKFQAERHGTAVEASIHRPHEHAELLNWHAHLHQTPRRLDEHGMTEKVRELDNPKQSGEHIEAWRQFTQQAINRALERAGYDETHFIDMRSYERQGIEREAQVHMGADAAALERAGIDTSAGDHNRDVKAINAAREREARRARLTDKANVIDFEEKLAAKDQRRLQEILQRQQALREGRLRRGLERLSQVENDLKARREGEERDQQHEREQQASFTQAFNLSSEALAKEAADRAEQRQQEAQAPAITEEFNQARERPGDQAHDTAVALVPHFEDAATDLAIEREKRRQEQQRREERARTYDQMMARERRELETSQQQERVWLQREQTQRRQQDAQRHGARFRTGFLGWWDKLTGKHAETECRNTAEREAQRQRDEADRQRLMEHQAQQRRAQEARHIQYEKDKREILEHGETRAVREAFEREARQQQRKGQEQRQQGMERGRSLGFER